MKTDKFILKRGKILHDVVNQDASLDATRDNMTEDLALYHLLTNPHAKQFFETLPGDVDKLVEEFGKKHEAEKLEKTRAESAASNHIQVGDGLVAPAEKLSIRDTRALKLATAVLELDDLIDNGGSIEERDEKREEVLALAREIAPLKPNKDGDGDNDNENHNDGGAVESGTEIKLNDGTIATLREGVAYNVDGTIHKRGTYEAADGGKLIIGNKGIARIETPAPTETKPDKDGDGGTPKE